MQGSCLYKPHLYTDQTSIAHKLISTKLPVHCGQKLDGNFYTVGLWALVGTAMQSFNEQLSLHA